MNFFLLLEFWQHGGGLRSVLWGVFKYKSGRNWGRGGEGRGGEGRGAESPIKGVQMIFLVMLRIPRLHHSEPNLRLRFGANW